LLIHLRTHITVGSSQVLRRLAGEIFLAETPYKFVKVLDISVDTIFLQ
jgi:hypothetical protein